MNDCPLCHIGVLESLTVAATFMKDGRWVAIEGIPAMVCDVCAERTYPQTSMDRVQQILSGADTPIDFRWMAVFDFTRISTATQVELPYSTPSVPVASSLASFDAPVVGQGSTVQEPVNA